MTEKTIICADRAEGYFADGVTVDEAYAEFVAFFGPIDIEKLHFYEAVKLPMQTGLDYD